ncbi:isocitrate lyase/PEP mutase family protein [Nocardiopsis potens]|uniref:isocitrate lyase/PEP mutase family protein n=1 Tax=Nocardiopsis potens TaxID=1246458 RepID=UPI0003462EC4|nr:isocitrate lyase/phosphoenolpyruvate mutase family protein [Nocardiopsis potens]
MPITEESADRARRLRELHRPGDPLVLVNVWDAASARTVAAVPGTAALATASWSIAAARGFADGERMPLEEMLDGIARVAAAVDLPVSADLERGYGADAAAVGASAARMLEAGAVGCNIEDGLPEGDPAGPLRPLDEQLERLRAVREAGERAGVPLVLNARTDALISGLPVREAVRRGRAFLDAGADCVFVLGAATVPVIGELVEALDGRVSVAASADGPPLPELAAAGVARVSMGPGPMGAAYAALRRLAEEASAGRPLPADLAFRPS